MCIKLCFILGKSATESNETFKLPFEDEAMSVTEIFD
jgi:hypothetical protein